MAIEYLSLPEVAEYIGVQRNTIYRYKLPPEDAKIGDRKGWLPQTIDDWNKRRPGGGNWANKRWNLPPELQ